MKKSKVFSRSQIALCFMVIALGTAVWLNMKYSGSIGDKNVKYLGEATYVSGEVTEPAAVETSAKVATDDYFSAEKDKREQAYTEAEELIEETLKTSDADDATKKDAMDSAAALAKRRTDETAIEALLDAKGFPDALAVLGDQGATVIVRKEGLLASETLQIQDAVVSQCSLELANIKIVTVGG